MLENKKCCWCCIAATEDFIIGCKRIYERMKWLNSIYPVEILITDNISDEICKAILQDIPYRKINELLFHSSKSIWIKEYKYSAAKIACWLLDNYDYVCYLETDILPMVNIDYIIDENIYKIDSPRQRLYLHTFPSVQNHTELWPAAAVILLRPSKLEYLAMSNFLTESDAPLDHQFFADYGKAKHLDLLCLSEEMTEQFKSQTIHIIGKLKLWNKKILDEVGTYFINADYDRFNKFIDANIIKLKLYERTLRLLYLVSSSNIKAFISEVENLNNFNSQENVQNIL